MAINSDSKQVYEEAYAYAVAMAKSGMSVEQLRNQLQARGLSVAEANDLIVKARAEARGDVADASAGSGGGGGMGWLVYIGILLFINLLLYLFNVPYFIY